MLPNLFPAEHYAARYNRQCASPASTKTSGKAVPKGTLDGLTSLSCLPKQPHAGYRQRSTIRGRFTPRQGSFGVSPKDVPRIYVVRGIDLILY